MKIQNNNLEISSKMKLSNSSLLIVILIYKMKIRGFLHIIFINNPIYIIKSVIKYTYVENNQNIKIVKTFNVKIALKIKIKSFTH